ncbi:MAG TPA: hypothetical protein VMD56_09325 [Steroidobacteraceae bacterium]|nr:hypothetical protein [Steroidobacteraceae bacterium]
MSVSSGRSRKHPWHAVSIVARGAACEQAMALRERRFLSTEAPRLPLSDCPFADQCACVYRHHTDRRAGPRRSSDDTGFHSTRAHQERRAGRGRRGSD